MAIPKSFPIRFTPRGLVDAFDATDKFPGACRQLSDLVFDQSNPEIMIMRPGVTQLSDFSGFDTPGFVSVQATIGTLVFGMVASNATPGYDEPFVYDLVSGLFLAVSGVTGGNVPTSPATFGAWTPPTIAQMGVYVVITHSGFSGTGTNFFGVIDMTNPAAPVWSSSDLATSPMGAVPTAVANFNNRLYFSVGNTLPYSDVLLLKRTLSSQQLTIGDGSPITALSGLPVQTTSSGVIAALIAFKESQCWQITGDTTLSNLSLNFISLTVGTGSPRSIAQSVNGIYFAGVAGPYVIDPLGFLRPVTKTIQESTPDISAPFINVTEPSRVSGAYAGSIYRVCLPTVINSIAHTKDYWFDEHKRRWTGPHSFIYDCASSAGSYFVLSGASTPAKILKSQSQSDPSSVFADLGSALAPVLLTSTFPKVSKMTEKQVVESTQELAANTDIVNFDITAQDEQGNALGNVSLTIDPRSGIWGATTWLDGHVWRSSLSIPHVYSLAWAAPLVFKKMALLILTSGPGQPQIGTHFSRYQDTGYVNLTGPNQP